MRESSSCVSRNLDYVYHRDTEYTENRSISDLPGDTGKSKPSVRRRRMTSFIQSLPPDWINKKINSVPLE